MYAKTIDSTLQNTFHIICHSAVVDLRLKGYLQFFDREVYSVLLCR